MGKFLLPALLLLLAPAQDSSLDRLIEKLASDTVEEREEAEKALIDAGAGAIPALQRALESKDVERSARAAAALRGIARRQEESGWADRVAGLASTLPLRLWKGTSGEYCSGTLKTTLEDGCLVFDDRIDGREGNSPIHYHCRAVCSADRFLTLRTLKAEKGKDGEVVQSCDLEVRDGLLLPRGVPGRPAGEAKPFGEHVTTWYGMLRLIGLLPQKTGFSLDVDLVTFSGSANTSRGQTLTCRGEEEVTVEGKRARVWVWDNNGVSFWVRDHRVCRMAASGQWEILFSDPAR